MFKRFFRVIKGYINAGRLPPGPETEALLAEAQETMRALHRENAVLASGIVIRARKRVKRLEAQEARIEKQIAEANLRRLEATVRQLQEERQVLRKRLLEEERLLDAAIEMSRKSYDDIRAEQKRRMAESMARLQESREHLERARSQYPSYPVLSRSEAEIVALVVLNLILLIGLMLLRMK